jgi:adenylate cyclase
MLAIGLNRSSEKTEVTESTGTHSTPASLAQPTLLILPFENLSADSAQEYFADGIVEDVITDLSRIETIRVLARSTSFTYKGRNVDPQEIAQELKLTHLVEGSVRRSGEELRITARLIDTGNSQNLWSQRYDRTVADIFEVQRDVAQNIVRALSINLTQEQQARVSSPPTSSFEAYDLYLKGRKALSLRTPEANGQARDYYRQAILLDPDFARAYGGIAVALTRFANKGWSDTPKVERDLALHYANKSVELNPESPYSLWALGFTHLYRHENEEAAVAVRKALRAAPGYADGMSLLALIYNYSAQAEEVIELIDEAMLINPLYSWDYLFNLGWAHYTLGNYEKAVKYQQLALERNEYATFARLILVASYMALNMPDDAAWQVEEVLAYHTNMSIRFLEQETPILLANDKMQQYLGHLLAAGVPPD